MKRYDDNKLGNVFQRYFLVLCCSAVIYGFVEFFLTPSWGEVQLTIVSVVLVQSWVAFRRFVCDYTWNSIIAELLFAVFAATVISSIWFIYRKFMVLF